MKHLPIIVALLCGCMSPVGVKLLPTQRTADPQCPCTKCGQPATGQYEIEGGGFEDRCDEHDPEQVVPKRKARSRIEKGPDMRPKKLERNVV